MKISENIKTLRGAPVIGLVLTIFLSSVILIVINYYTLKTMSAVRAYINGESYYSKGEKNATNSLISYLNTGSESDWQEYLTYIRIPLGDSVARTALLENGDVEVIKEGLRGGQNHPEDLDNMIWLFRNFQEVPLMAQPIRIWKAGDSLIYQKRMIAQQIRQAMSNEVTEEQKQEFLAELKENTMALTTEEKMFSESMGSAARSITNYLFYANVFLILLILSALTVYVYVMLKRINEKNADLLHANMELDRLVYTISHDLRAPINSMLGLVGLAEREKDLSQLGNYFSMMNKALKKQESFVKETIEMSRENRSAVKREIVDLAHLIDQVISLHHHMPEAQGVHFSTQIGVYKVFTDKHRLEVILGNLISNAIKYHDHTKSDRFIKVATSSHMDRVRIDVIDNGIGIDQGDQVKVFEMFYMSAATNSKGSGLGLYIVNDMVTKLGGKVEVKSKRGEGSTFSVVLKK